MEMLERIHINLTIRVVFVLYVNSLREKARKKEQVLGKK